MNMFEILPEYVNEILALFGRNRVKWISEREWGSRKSAGIHGYIHLIKSSQYPAPLFEDFKVENGMLVKRNAFSVEEAWGIQIWGEDSYETASDFAGWWSHSDSINIQNRKNFTIVNVSDIMSVDDSVLSSNKNVDFKRMAVDLDVSYRKIVERVVSEDGNVIDSIPLNIRKGIYSRDITVSREN